MFDSTPPALTTSPGARSITGPGAVFQKGNFGPHLLDDELWKPLPVLLPVQPSFFTPAPVHGSWPIKHATHPMFLFRNLTPGQIQNWFSIPRGTIVQVYDHAATTASDRAIMCGRIKKLVCDILELVDIRVAPPIPASELLPPPLSYLVLDLPEGADQSLISHHCYSTVGLTIFCYPVGSTMPRFICGLTGFTTDNHNILAAVVRTRLDSEPTRTVISALVGANPNMAGMGVAEATEAILDSIDVQMLPMKAAGGFPMPVANVYIDSPTSDISAWKQWKAHVRSIKYATYCDGVGIAQDFPHCMGCHSYDHPRGLCPYPKIQGWRGPAATAPRERGEPRQDPPPQARAPTARVAPLANHGRWSNSRAPQGRADAAHASGSQVDANY